MASFRVLIALVLLGVATARPRFVAIPVLQDFKIVEVEDVPDLSRPRIARQIPFEAVRPAAQQTKQTLQGLEAEDTADSLRFERQAGGGGDHEHVDYGAHTGHHGAFGWYADFPVHSH